MAATVLMESLNTPASALVAGRGQPVKSPHALAVATFLKAIFWLWSLNDLSSL
jgi:hypothetical protein